MTKSLITTSFVLLFLSSFSQDIRITGSVRDTAAKQPMNNVLLTIVRFSDSSLVGFTRTDMRGNFKPIHVAPDTFIVTMSHAGHSDLTYFILPNPGDTAYHFNNVILPPNTMALKEVEIKAYREKSFYKGDTLVFIADSFKTRANATVEDLLKKLPGFKVDARGKITVQGKEVDQVLVDGDEFFGGDPTIATRNLNASSIENVQVYEKKNENAEEGKDDKLKVVNLQLKDDARNGYFGKASGASDFNKYFENEFLANRFKRDMKLSAFGLVANTPKQAFDWNEIQKYGLTGEEPWSYDEETGNWSSNQDQTAGIPQTLKSGIYYSDKPTKKAKISGDYTFNENRLKTNEEVTNQFFLPDTSYINKETQSNTSLNRNHVANARYVGNLDSLTELTLLPKGKYVTMDRSSNRNDEFISSNGILTRSTAIYNNNSMENKTGSMQVLLIRKFKKKDRRLTINYLPSYESSVTNSSLTTVFEYFRNQLADSTLKQKRTQQYEKREHNASITYVEPLSKKFRAEINYNFNRNDNSSSRATYDLGGTNDFLNTAQSNSFQNQRITNRGGIKFIYDVKKLMISVGSQYRRVDQRMNNITNGTVRTVTNYNLLPNAMVLVRLKQSSNIRINFATGSQLPEVKQLQPVIDNTNPNRLSTGNPSLQPSFTQSVNFNYYFYKGISDIYFYSGANASRTDQQISYRTDYDSMGRAISYPVNINGNYFANAWAGMGIPIFKKFMKINYSVNGGIFNNASYVNGVINNSQNININPHLSFDKQTDMFEVEIGGEYSYNVPKAKINLRSNQPYYTYSINGDVSVKLPKKFIVSTDGKYTNNGNRAPGYNLNYFIWNASIAKVFLKYDQLIVSVEAYDILNQNISNQRTLSANMITDQKTQIIKRYLLLKVLYKFNSQKDKMKDEGDED